MLDPKKIMIADRTEEDGTIVLTATIACTSQLHLTARDLSIRKVYETILKERLWAAVYGDLVEPLRDIQRRIADRTETYRGNDDLLRVLEILIASVSSQEPPTLPDVP